MVWTACKIFIVFSVLTGCIYPLLITEIATVAMPYQANGSLIFYEGQLKGSKLIGQPFTGEKYFWPRPSLNNYNPLSSTGSNLGPTSRKLKELVKQNAEKFQQSNADQLSIPSELVYASGSGLDPHISVDGAHFQLERVARARSLNPKEKEKVLELIDQYTEAKAELLGPRHVNVLLLNMALDKTFSPAKQS